MKKHRLKHIDLNLYTETLPNGLLVNIVVKKKVNNIYVTFSTKYGSFQNEFIPIGEKKMFTAPLGVAHFLEHKVFEQKNGKDPFEFYTRNGADTNASTSHLKTTYLFSGIGHFKENIEYLLDFVQTPHFTKENVEKEKGIIEQEIKMYEDIPFWKLFDKTLSNSFFEHPLKYPIAGTIQSINEITKEDLYKCYNTFYHPSNMFVTIVGDVNPEEVIEIIASNQASKKYPIQSKIVLKEYAEKDEVVKAYEEIIFDVELPKVAVAYKINSNGNDANRLKRYLGSYINIKTGSTSKLFEKLKMNNLLTGDIETEIVIAGDHLLCVLLFESREYTEVLQEIDQEIKNKAIDEQDLNRKKKVSKSSCVFRSDSIYSLASKINGNILNHNKVILDEFKDIDSFNIEELKGILNRISFENKTITVVKSR